MGLLNSTLLYSTVIALLTTGFNLTNTTSKFPNLGHTVNLGIGISTSFLVTYLFNTPPFVSIPFSLFVSGIYNLISYRLIFSKIKKPEFAVLAGSALLFLNEDFSNVLSLYLKDRIDLSQSKIGGFVWHLHYPRNTYFGISEGIIVLLSVLLISYLFYWRLSGSSIWLEVWACVDNPDLAQIQGINPERIRMISWFIAGGLGGVAGSILPYLWCISPNVSMSLSLIVFASAAFSGLRSPKFGFYGGLVVGSLEQVLVLWAMRVFGNEVVEFTPIFSVLVLSVSFWVMGKTKRFNIYSN